jgi:hypothetical protein
MSNEKETPVEKVNTAAPMTMEAMMKLFLDQQKETAIAQKALAEALLESRKPYIDPRYLAELEQRRKDRKALVDLEIKKRAYAKRACQHLNEGGKLNIKWMQHSEGIILGVCGICQSQFDATHNREDAKLLMQDPKSIRWMGRAGEHARRGVEVAL